MHSTSVDQSKGETHLH
jgi:hypothetical protein